MYRSFQEFWHFYTKHPRFKLVPLMYSKKRSIKQILIEWFENDGLDFDLNDPRSNSFWAEDESVDLLTLEMATCNL
jgi:hypothetical protein